VVHFDFYLTVGGGVVQTNRSADIKGAGSFAIGWRLMITRWFTFVVEFKDHIFVEAYNRGDEVVNNLVLQAGFSIFLPPDYGYKYSR
jgi:outer membrane beta-barrel protein